jgi:hypothetical protein
VHLLPQYNCQVTPVTMSFNSKSMVWGR